MAILRLEKTHSRAAQNSWFSVGVVIFLSYQCHRSPGYSLIMDIPEQQEIKNIIHEQHKIKYLKINW
jgi:hypothetical protein